MPLLLYTIPLLAVHACEAWFDDGLVVPRLPVGVRYSIYTATCYLTLLFGNFGGRGVHLLSVLVNSSPLRQEPFTAEDAENAEP